MTRLTDRLAALKAKGEKALVCYIVTGDPSVADTVKIVKALDAAGVDAVEVGIPFSDPVADGPSIQAASQRALDRGVLVRDAFKAVAEVRKTSQIPIVLMTYYNPVLHYGTERFAKDAAAAGADATIVTDLTPEEADEWCTISAAAGLNTIFLAAPTSTAARISRVCDMSTGFVYYVSRTGVTGARADLPEGLGDQVRAVKTVSRTPVFVGFGISKPEQVATVCEFADGCVVGSALVNLVGREGGATIEEVEAFASALKAGTRKAPAQ